MSKQRKSPLPTAHLHGKWKAAGQEWREDSEKYNDGDPDRSDARAFLRESIDHRLHQQRAAHRLFRFWRHVRRRGLGRFGRRIDGPGNATRDGRLIAATVRDLWMKCLTLHSSPADQQSHTARRPAEIQPAQESK